MFEMHLSGLCLLVPSTSAPTRVRALLADTTAASGGMGHLMDLHEPLLIVDADDFDDQSSDRGSDLTFLTAGGSYAAFLLRDQELSVPALGTDPVTWNDNPNLNNCTTLGNFSNLAWLAHIANISTGSDTVRNDCFYPYPTAYAKVAARVQLHQGTLSTARIARDHDKNLVKWDFQKPDGSYLNTPTSLADDVMLAIDVSGSITFQTILIRDPTTPYLDGLYTTSHTRTISLTPNTTDLIVMIANSPLADVMGVRPPTTGRREPDIHFDYYYDLSQTPKSRNIPVQLDICPDTGQPSLRSPQCPPALAAPNLNA